MQVLAKTNSARRNRSTRMAVNLDLPRFIEKTRNVNYPNIEIILTKNLIQNILKPIPENMSESNKSSVLNLVYTSGSKMRENVHGVRRARCAQQHLFTVNTCV